MRRLTALFALALCLTVPTVTRAWDDEPECRVCDCPSATAIAKATATAVAGACSPTLSCPPVDVEAIANACASQQPSQPAITCARGRCKVITFANGSRRSVCRHRGCTSSVVVE